MIMRKLLELLILVGGDKSEAIGIRSHANKTNHNNLFDVEDQVIYKIGIFTTFLIELGFALYLMNRQHSHISSQKNVPKLLRLFGSGAYTKRDLTFSREYSLDKLMHLMGAKMYTITLWTLIVYFDLISLTWNLTTHLNFLWPKPVDSTIGRNMAFAMCCYLASELLLLPVYCHQVEMKAKYDNWKHSDYFVPHFVNLATSLFIIGVGAGVLTWALMMLDKSSVLTQTLILGFLSILFVLLYPTLEVWRSLHKLENNEKLKITDNSGLKIRLNILCDQVGFPRKQVVLLPSGSSETSAFYYGFLWYRRIVVLIHECSEQSDNDSADSDEDNDDNRFPNYSLTLTTEETEGIVAHELGHWQYTHSDKSLLIWHAMQISTMLFAYWLYSSEMILKILAFKDPDLMVAYLPGVFIAYFMILRAYCFVFEILFQLHSHLNEREADTYATQLGYSRTFGKGLVKIVLAQKTTFPSSDPMYQVCYHNHPSLVQRLILLNYQSQLQ